MGERVTVTVEDKVATITMDDGKANALSLAMQAELNAALDEAEAAGATVVIGGREGMFSGGFDLKVLQAGGPEARAMLTGGLCLAERLLAFPTPVVIGAGGHAIAMGAFLLLSADYRIGAAGGFKIGANEVAIGMVMPRAAIELCRQRIRPSHLTRSLLTAEIFDPEGALEAGYLDEIAAPEELAGRVAAKAAQLATLDMPAYLGTKLRLRRDHLAALRSAIEADDEEFARSL
jgi:enoyl-CoA hydratase